MFIHNKISTHNNSYRLKLILKKRILLSKHHIACSPWPKRSLKSPPHGAASLHMIWHPDFWLLTSAIPAPTHTSYTHTVKGGPQLSLSPILLASSLPLLERTSSASQPVPHLLFLLLISLSSYPDRKPLRHGTGGLLSPPARCAFKCWATLSLGLPSESWGPILGDWR